MWSYNNNKFGYLLGMLDYFGSKFERREKEQKTPIGEQKHTRSKAIFELVKDEKNHKAIWKEEYYGSNIIDWIHRIFWIWASYDRQHNVSDFNNC